MNKPNIPIPPTRQLTQVIDGHLDSTMPDKRSKWFGSIQYRPKSVNFATQNHDEKVYLILRTHWIKNLGWVFKNMIYAFIPILILYIVEHFNIPVDFISLKVYVIMVLAYYSVILTNILRNFYDWYFDVYIVTNQRVLSYDFKPFSSYKILEAELESIQDVQESAGGVISNMFNYGDLKIRTASHLGELYFKSIPDPTEVRNILMDLIQVINNYRDGL